MGWLLLKMSERFLTSYEQPVCGFGVYLMRAMIEKTYNFINQFMVLGCGHSVIPNFLNVSASVCVALEQCVLTLPSEQPMAFAASATSISSQ